MHEPTPGNSPGLTDPDGDPLLAYVHNRDVSCPSCGYNLRMISRPACPECGRELKLTVGVVGLANTWITSLVAAIIPAACGLPFQIIFFIALAYGEVGLSDIDEPIVLTMVILLFYSLGCWVVSILLLVMRKQFMRLRSNTQTTIAAVLVIAVVLAALIIIGVIMSA